MRSAILACILLTLALTAFGQHSKTGPVGGKTTNSKSKPKPKPTPKIPGFEKFVNEWRELGVGGGFTMYYQWASVNKTEQPGTLRVWVKLIPIDLSKMRETLQKTAVEGQKFDDYSYTLTLYGIRCGARQSSLIEADYYSEKGVLLTTDKIDGEWGNIIPESNLEGLRKIICP